MTKGIIIRGSLVFAVSAFTVLLMAGNADAQSQLFPFSAASGIRNWGLGPASAAHQPSKVDMMANGGLDLNLEDGVTNNYVSDNRRLSMVPGVNGNLNFRKFEEFHADRIGELVIRGVAQAANRTIDNSANAAVPMYEAFLNGAQPVDLIPEPSTWVMTILGASLLLSVQRFRKKKD